MPDPREYSLLTIPGNGYVSESSPLIARLSHSPDQHASEPIAALTAPARVANAPKAGDRAYAQPHGQRILQESLVVAKQPECFERDQQQRQQCKQIASSVTDARAVRSSPQ